MRGTHIHFIFLSLLINSLFAAEHQQEYVSQRLDPLGDGTSFVQLVDGYGDDLGIVNAARISYDMQSPEFGGKDQNLLRRLVENGHGTPFEQAGLQFHVKVPCDVAHQWNKQRMGVSFYEKNMQSSAILDIYIPTQNPLYRSLDRAQVQAIYRKTAEESLKNYAELLKAGIPNQQAQSCLPSARYIELAIAYNLRALLHFSEKYIKGTDKPHAFELGQYAKAMIQLAWPYFDFSLSEWCKKNQIGDIVPTEPLRRARSMKSEPMLPLGEGSMLQLVDGYGSDHSIANTKLVSFDRQDTTDDADIITKLIESQDEAPLEHTGMRFKVWAPIYVTRQWMRHRTDSYNEKSGRYSPLKNGAYEPDHWRITSQDHAGADAELQAIYGQSIKESAKAYDTLVEMKAARELARGVLPVSAYTKFFFGCNLRSLLNFIKLRADSHAQQEIQQYAKGMLQQVQTYFPITIGAWLKANAEWCRKNNIIID